MRKEEQKWLGIGESFTTLDKSVNYPFFRIDQLSKNSLPAVATLTAPTSPTSQSHKGAHLLLDIVHQYWLSWLAMLSQEIDNDIFNPKAVNLIFKQALDEWKQILLSEASIDIQTQLSQKFLSAG